mgnify:CR=1 FL=1
MLLLATAAGRVKIRQAFYYRWLAAFWRLILFVVGVGLWIFPKQPIGKVFYLYAVIVAGSETICSKDDFVVVVSDIW